VQLNARAGARLGAKRATAQLIDVKGGVERRTARLQGTISPRAIRRTAPPTLALLLTGKIRAGRRRVRDG